MSEEANAASNAASESVQADSGSQVQTEAQVLQEVSAVQTTEAEKPSASTREALEKAFAKVDGEQGEKPDRARGPDGKFVKQDAQQQQLPPAEQQTTADALKAEEAAKAAAEKDAQEAAKQTVQVNPPPPGFTKAAQEAWAQTPEAVRADVERRVSELTAGYEKYKGAYEPIARFDEMARQSGTTLDKALEAYVGIEDLMRSNPVQGIVQVCQNIGIDPRQMTAWMVQAMNGQMPQNMQVTQQQRPQTPAEIAELKKELEAIKQTNAQRDAERTVTDFASARDEAGQLKHPYFNELSETISEMLSTKFAKDLSDAYQKAVRLNPEIAAKIEQDKAARTAKPANQPDPAQTREKASKSITGTPSSASNATARKAPGSTREALQNAFAQVGLG